MRKTYFIVVLLTGFLGCQQSKSDMKDSQKQAIESYIKSYNAFDVDGMLRDLSEDVVFENISAGELDMKLEGLTAFREQAQAATAYFRQREQKIRSWKNEGDKITIEIDYMGILDIELPNGLKPGDTLTLKGKSTFAFSGEKIIQITDES